MIEDMPPFRLFNLIVVAILIQPSHLYDSPFSGLNVALGMPAFEGPDIFTTHYASLAVNGNLDNNVNDGSCAHTGKGMEAWWSVHLQGSLIIRGIRIYNRDILRERLENFRVVGVPGNVELYNDELVPQDEKLYMEAIISIIVNNNEPFTDIMVTLPGNFLTLCEVQIFSEFCKLPDISGTDLSYTYNGSHARDGWIYVGTVVTFTCTKEDVCELIGDASISCLADGSYSGNIPKCVQCCPTPPDVVNGYYTDLKDRYISGDLVWFECFVDFLPRTDSEITCRADATWSESNPTCSIVTCSHPGQILHGYYVFSNGSRFIFGNVNFNTTIEVLCEEGYVSLFNIRQCSASAAWTGEGKCLAISSIYCSLDSLRPGENFYTLDQHYGEFVGYDVSITATCLSGYTRRSGDSVRRCLSNQHLSGSEFVCSAVNCSLDLLQPADNLYMFNKNYGGYIMYNDAVSASCQAGCDRLRGDQTRICLADQSFSGTELVCSLKSGKHVVVENNGVPKAAFGGALFVAFILPVIICVIGIIMWRRRVNRNEERTHDQRLRINIHGENLNPQRGQNNGYRASLNRQRRQFNRNEDYLNGQRRHGYRSSEDVNHLLAASNNANASFSSVSNDSDGDNVSDGNQSARSQTGTFNSSLNQCCVCYERNRESFLIPCGHAYCTFCAVQLQSITRSCAICRAEITGIGRLHDN